MKSDLALTAEPIRKRREPSSESSREAPLPSPAKTAQDIPLSERARETIAKGRREIADILSGRDRERLLVVCGPCSIHDVNAAVVYADKLRRLSDQVSDDVLLVMRTYFEKPRSVVGWKGLLYDPLSDGPRSASSGIALARRLLARINDSGLPCATEFLNPMLARYLEDAISYGSIGSRTVESQIHRELASRLPMPVGMKNAMDGNPDSAVNAVRSASLPHAFYGCNEIGLPCLIETGGNPLAHVILRGGASGPNFDEASVGHAAAGAESGDLRRPVVVDCSHGNSRKDHTRQAGVAREVMRQFVGGQSGIAGLMLESNLVEGRQDAEGTGARRFGQSITDACIGWSDTEDLVLSMVETIRGRH